MHPWFKNAVFYSLDVETFYDADGDGIGDFRGLIQRLDYVAGLGVNCVWLLPFYPSPNRDNGYDVTDYYNVDARLGTLGDFAEFLTKAKGLGLRIVIDLVVNHTSLDHPWFQQARKDKQSPYRDYYVWSDEALKYETKHLMLQGEEDGVWTYDETAGQYYLHRFYKEQPDLNVANPRVKEEILKIMGFWLRLGVDGFRIDAAQPLVESYGLEDAGKENLLQFLNEMRDFAQTLNGEAVLLAEVASGPKEMQVYLERNERMNMLFNFFANQHLFLSLATENKTALERVLQKFPPMHNQTQWLHFLRHHDELNLKLLTKKDRQQVLDAFAPEEEMRIYGHGIRRRLAPMMQGDEKRIKLAYSLLFSLPGAQLIRYGDEFGMGENLSLPGRSSVRTPMQWSPVQNAGFSTAPEAAVVHPVVKDRKFGFEKVNVLAAQQHAASLLNWIERLITTRKQCSEIGFGKLFVLPYRSKHVMIHGVEWKGQTLFFLHNFSAHPQVVPLKKLDVSPDVLFVFFGEEGIHKQQEHITLKAYGFNWLRAAKTKQQ